MKEIFNISKILGLFKHCHKKYCLRIFLNKNSTFFVFTIRFILDFACDFEQNDCGFASDFKRKQVGFHQSSVR